MSDFLNRKNVIIILGCLVALVICLFGNELISNKSSLSDSDQQISEAQKIAEIQFNQPNKK